MQDRTPAIAEHGTHCAPYTGDYASVLLDTVRRHPGGVTTTKLMDGLGIMSSHDQTFPDFVEAVDHLHDCGLIWSKEYDELSEEQQALRPGQIWRIV
jgi:hypothetical protein